MIGWVSFDCLMVLHEVPSSNVVFSLFPIWCFDATISKILAVALNLLRAAKISFTTLGAAVEHLMRLILCILW